MLVDADNLSPNAVYHLMMQTILPRPIAWVLTENAGGSLNLAPFSYFNAVASAPPLLMVSIGCKPDGSPKDTRANIECSGRFVVHVPAKTDVFEVSESSRTLPYGESEVQRQNLETVAFGDFPLPRLARCRVAFACELHQSLELGEGPQYLAFGRIRQVHVDDALVEQDGRRLNVDAQASDPLARLGGDQYGFLGGVIRVPRPD